ncbi:MAG TPA: SMI1/KNR4 family protein [Archangium sp.]|nr:SMI1/KNR4 family protein [Archangium sp.]
MKTFVETIARYVPTYPESLRPASPAEIQQLEERIGRCLPASYRSFLELMGHGVGALDMFGADFDISTIIDLHAPGRWRAPERYLRIARQKEHPRLDVYLDLGWNPAEPRVVRFESWGEISEENEDFCVVFNSLPEMWFSFAFLQLRMPLLPYRAFYAPARQDPDAKPVPYIERLDTLARKLGFERIPCTSLMSPCYERGDAALKGYEPDAYSLGIVLAVQQEQERMRIEQLLEDHVCVVRSQAWQV